jgi:site-specific recombinase
MITSFWSFMVGCICILFGLVILLYCGCTIAYWILENATGDRELSLKEIIQSQWTTIKQLRIF